MTTETRAPARAANSLVVVSNRLPVDRVTSSDGTVTWRTSPGGLVTAMEAVVSDLGCVWVGWPGSAGEDLEPFTVDRMELVPVTLNEADVAEYYEGFSNATIWPLYHDVIAQPRYHREWWDRYVEVNRTFAAAAASAAADGATVWVHDYHLQLVPELLRALRPDLRIGFFLHIPFPAFGLFSQLPWRRRVLQGLLGADVVGFQRATDAANFRAAARRYVGSPSNGNVVHLGAEQVEGPRQVLAQEFPISIDARAFDRLARRPEVQQRAREIRTELGDPGRVILGVDRLDYTKGIRHRLKAFAELLRDGEIAAGDVTMVQVASPSRERVDAYRQLRDEIEITVSRINGDYGTIAHSPVVYLHQGFPREEMAALYLAADVLVVTALRDGMNLVAKEYAACRFDERGSLVLSEFTGAADHLRRAVLVNPHDTNGVKAAFMEALRMPEEEQRQRMRSLRRTVFRNDVGRWADDFLRALDGQRVGDTDAGGSALSPVFLHHTIDDAVRRLANEPELLVACDFDGTLAPIVTRPEDARILPRAENALQVLQHAPGVRVAILSGRAVQSLRDTGLVTAGRIVAGSHGAELIGLGGTEHVGPDRDEQRRIAELRAVLAERVDAVDGAWIEEKPFGFAVHVREVSDRRVGQDLLDVLEARVRALGLPIPVHIRSGKRVREFSLSHADKGAVLKRIRAELPGVPVLFLGDDVTDEDALRTLGEGDVGVRVGTGETAATHRVADPAAAAAMLARLAELRTGTVVGTE